MIAHSHNPVKGWHSPTRQTKVRNERTFSSSAYLEALMNAVDRGAICSRLKHARKEARLSQREVAERFAVHENTVQLWENGQKNKRGVHAYSVPWDRMDDLAEMYGVTVGWVRHGDSPPLNRPSPVEAQLERFSAAIDRLVNVLERFEDRLDDPRSAQDVP